MLFPKKKMHKRGGPSLRSIAAKARRQRERMKNETPKQRETRLAKGRGYRKRKAERAAVVASLLCQIETESQHEEYGESSTHEEHDPLDVENLTDSNKDIAETKDAEIRKHNAFSLNFKYFVEVGESKNVNNICKKSNEEMDQMEEELPTLLLPLLRPEETQGKPTRNAHPWRFDDPCGSGIVSDFPPAHSVVSSSIVSPLEIHLQPLPSREASSSTPIRTVYALCSEKKLKEPKAPAHPSLSRTRPPTKVYPPRLKAQSKYSIMPAWPCALEAKNEFAPLSEKKTCASEEKPGLVSLEVLSRSNAESHYAVSPVSMKTEPEYVSEILPDTSMDQDTRIPFRLKEEPGFDSFVEGPLNSSSIENGHVPFRLKKESETTSLCMELALEDGSTIQNGHVSFRLKEENTSSLRMEHALEDGSMIQNGDVSFRLKEENDTSSLCMERASEDSLTIQNGHELFPLKKELETASLCVEHSLENNSMMDGTELL